jgi:hypothetical protein
MLLAVLAHGWWIVPRAVDAHAPAADLTVRLMPGAFFVEAGDVVPLDVVADGLVAVLAAGLAPLRRALCLTLLVRFGRVLPVTVDAHAPAANLAGLFVPCALLVVPQRIVPVFMDG